MGNRGELNLIIVLGCCPFEIDMLIELISLCVVYSIELFQEGFLCMLVFDGVVMLDEMLLSVLFNPVEEITLHILL